ncbi:hypothetical protein PCE1_004847 [Barthelona sp. PCE]
MNLPPGKVIYHRYQVIGRPLGRGTFGQVIDAIDQNVLRTYNGATQEGNRVAIKIATSRRETRRAMMISNKYLRSEYSIIRDIHNYHKMHEKPKHMALRYKLCRRYSNFTVITSYVRVPTLLDLNSFENTPTKLHHGFMVMEKLNNNIYALKKEKIKRFGLQRSMHYAIQMLENLQHVHEAGYIHRDVKPSNFCLGPLNDVDRGNEVFLIDFGMAKNYLGMNNRHIPPKSNAGFRGTTRYASINAHNRMELSRRDDLFSWFYSVLEMIGVNLPWKASNDKSAVLIMKINFHEARRFASPHNGVFQNIFEEINTLDFADTPNYKRIYTCLQFIIDHTDSETEIIVEGANPASVWSATGKEKTAVSTRSDDKLFEDVHIDFYDEGKQEENNYEEDTNQPSESTDMDKQIKLVANNETTQKSDKYSYTITNVSWDPTSANNTTSPQRVGSTLPSPSIFVPLENNSPTIQSPIDEENSGLFTKEEGEIPTSIGNVGNSSSVTSFQIFAAQQKTEEEVVEVVEDMDSQDKSDGQNTTEDVPAFGTISEVEEGNMEKYIEVSSVTNSNVEEQVEAPVIQNFNWGQTPSGTDCENNVATGLISPQKFNEKVSVKHQLLYDDIDVEIDPVTQQKAERTEDKPPKPPKLVLQKRNIPPITVDSPSPRAAMIVPSKPGALRHSCSDVMKKSNQRPKRNFTALLAVDDGESSTTNTGCTCALL